MCVYSLPTQRGSADPSRYLSWPWSLTFLCSLQPLRWSTPAGIQTAENESPMNRRHVRVSLPIQRVRRIDHHACEKCTDAEFDTVIILPDGVSVPVRVVS
jgi:hypothetical protein